MRSALPLYIFAKNSRGSEAVTLSENKVAIEADYDQPERRLEFTGPWTGGLIDENNESWLPSRSLIRSGSKEVEIGRLLIESERVELANELKKQFHALFEGIFR